MRILVKVEIVIVSLTSQRIFCEHVKIVNFEKVCINIFEGIELNKL